MKKCIYQALPIGTVLMIFSQFIVAQSPTPPVPPPPPPVPGTRTETVDRTEQKEIIIRQKGDKDSKVTIEIRNGDYFINGKPLEKFDDSNVIIEKIERDDEDGPQLSFAPSQFRVNPWNEDQVNKMQQELSGRDMQRNIRKSIRVNLNSAYLGVSSRKTEKGGATVLEITKGSPAEKAGLKKGDIITRINDKKIENPDGLYETIHDFKPGDKVKITYTRDGKDLSATATLDKTEFAPNAYNFKYNYDYKMPEMDLHMPGMGSWNNADMDDWNFGKPKLGIKAQDAENGKGVDVLEVNDSSAASKAGLKKGDLILQVDGSDVNSVNELVEQTMMTDRKKYTLKFKIQRNGISQDIEVKIPRKLKTAEL